MVILENSFADGYWTYSLENIHKGVKGYFKNLSENVFKDYGVALETVGAIGVSAMMHGYLPFDKNGKIVGVVTHVFVNDPTRGYGIFIENMLVEAEKIK